MFLLNPHALVKQIPAEPELIKAISANRQNRLNRFIFDVRPGTYEAKTHNLCKA